MKARSSPPRSRSSRAESGSVAAGGWVCSTGRTRTRRDPSRPQVSRPGARVSAVIWEQSRAGVRALQHDGSALLSAGLRRRLAEITTAFLRDLTGRWGFTRRARLKLRDLVARSGPPRWEAARDDLSFRYLRGDGIESGALN